METKELLEKLAKKYPKPGWVFIPNVRNSTGFPGTLRTADAIAMGLWPSRGLHLHGFELKISRSDWMRELKDPEKAEEISQYCDFWWLVLSEEKLIEPGEVPATWGIMIANGRGGAVKVIREATQRANPIVPPWFLASLLRSATEGTVPEAMIATRLEEEFERGKQSNQWEITQARMGQENAEKAVAEFEKVSGIKIDGWGAGRLGYAVKLVLAALESKDSLVRDLKWKRENMADLLKKFDGAITALEGGAVAEEVPEVL